MVTRAELLKDAGEQKAAERREEAKQQRERAAWRKQKDAEDLLRAQTLVDGELGDALKRWNLDKHYGMCKSRKVRLDESRCWHEYEHMPGAWGEIYGDRFCLDIDPDKDSDAMRELIKNLEEAGFHARRVSEEHQNLESYTDAQGQAFRELPGTHLEWFLEIDWS